MTTETTEQTPQTLRQAWEAYAQELQNRQSGKLTPAFLEKLEVLYMMGAKASFQLFWAAGNLDDEDAGAKKIEDIYLEIVAFIEGIENGKH